LLLVSLAWEESKMVIEYLYQASVVSQQIISSDSLPIANTPAYLDPGTGSLIIQIAIGALVGGLVAARVFWKRAAWYLKNLFSGGSKHGKADE
jgi:hypothetical protein